MAKIKTGVDSLNPCEAVLSSLNHLLCSQNSVYGTGCDEEFLLLWNFQWRQKVRLEMGDNRTCCWDIFTHSRLGWWWTGCWWFLKDTEHLTPWVHDADWPKSLTIFPLTTQQGPLYLDAAPLHHTKEKWLLTKDSSCSAQKQCTGRSMKLCGYLTSRSESLIPTGILGEAAMGPVLWIFLGNEKFLVRAYLPAQPHN